MSRWMDLRSVLLAGAFFALGFLVADRMTHVSASPTAALQDSNGAAYSGTDGAIAAKSQILIIRGHKIYLVDPARGGPQRPWGDLVE
jgi:hypothetical protein